MTLTPSSCRKRGLTVMVFKLDGRDVEELVGELAEFVRQTGRAHHEMLQAEVLPVAGNA